MYSQSTIPIKSSTSLLYNNLDVLSTGDDVLYNVVHKSNVWVFNPVEVKENPSSYKRVLCKGEGSQNSSTILQAKWCVLPQRTLLVVASLKGVHMFDSHGSSMFFWQALQPNPKEGCPQFARGITAVADRYICVGTADGNILVFDVPSKGNGVRLHETIEAHSSSINDLNANGDSMVSSDDLGNITLWKAGGAFSKGKEIEGFGYPCTSVRLLDSSIVAGYGSGHIRSFDRTSGVIRAEVTAHAKWINAIDATDDENLLLSVSEDTYLRVWNVKTFEVIFQKCITDVQLTGCRFLDIVGDSFGVSGYDSSDIYVFKK